MPRKDHGYAASLRAGRTANRRRLDRQLEGLEARVGPRPPGGWIRKIRDALGMSTMELAARLGVTRARVSQLEQAEVQGSIPLSSLQRAAAALNCQICYAFVPDEPLEQMVRRQAVEQAARAVAASLSAARRSEAGETGEKGEKGEKGEEGELGEESGTEAQPDVDEVAARVEALAHELVDRRGLWRLPRRYSPTEPP
jgi:predicted DNA-binding mobile mystery protein A